MLAKNMKFLTGLAAISSFSINEALCSTTKIRVGTFNIRNIADRYDEREILLGKTISEFNCDLLGTQEVCWTVKDQVSFLEKLTNMRGFKAPKYFPQHLPPNKFCIDGNCALVNEKKFKVLQSDLLPLSDVRIAQKITLETEDGKKIWFVNTHLHHWQPCDYYIDQSVGQHDVDQRIEEVKKICEWCKDFKEEGIDAVIITGDFNAHYTEMSYLTFIIHGYQSCFYVANGKEPLLTFPSGLIADTMDMSMALTTDYIFVQGDVKIISAKIAADEYDPNDATLYPSDHVAIISEIEI